MPYTPKISSSGPRPSKPATLGTPPPNPPKTATSSTLLIAVTVMAVLAVICWVSWRTYFGPRSAFQPQTAKREYVRDALDGKIPQVSLTDIFSPSAIKDYQRGSGFELTFRVLNDPRNGYNDSSKMCSLEAWSRFAQTSNPKRRALVSTKQQEVDQCLSWFTEVLGITRTVEIALDDTDGVDEDLRRFVKSRLEGLEKELASTNDTVRLFVFRLTDEDYLDFQRVEFKPGTPLVEAKDELDKKLDWLAEPRAPAPQSSIATGLFNALNLNRDVHKRKVIVFTDGMENSPRTTTFYPAVRDSSFFEESNWVELDQLISRQMECPDLSRTEIRWYAPQIPGSHIRAAQKYWKHVLEGPCKVPSGKIEMFY